VTDVEVIEHPTAVDIDVERTLKEPVELRLRQFQSVQASASSFGIITLPE
jgi:hypothetical protein